MFAFSGEMMLFRLVVVIAVAVMLLPTDERKQSELYASARFALERTVTFCDRNAQMCESGREMWAVFVRKAEFGLELVTKLARGNGSGAQHEAREAGPVAPAATSLNTPLQPLPALPAPVEARHVQPVQAPPLPPAAPTPRAQSGRGTLQPSDTQPAWRTPAAQRAATM